jgi:hypothetical protein
VLALSFTGFDPSVTLGFRAVTINVSPIDRVSPALRPARSLFADDDGAQRPRDIGEAERTEGDQQEQLLGCRRGKNTRGSSRRKKP